MNAAVNAMDALRARLLPGGKAVDTVRDIGSPPGEAVTGGIVTIQDISPGIRELAADLLVRCDADMAPELLVTFLADQDISPRSLAQALARIGADAVEPLLDRINSDDSAIRRFVVEVLGLIRDGRAVAELVPRLRDEDLDTACSAAWALGEIGSNSATPHLIAIFDSDPDIRIEVLVALGKIADPNALEALYRWLDTADLMLLSQTVRTIGLVGRVSSVPQLISFLNHDDRSVAETALTAIVDIMAVQPDAAHPDLNLDRFSEFLIDAIRSQNGRITRFAMDHMSRHPEDGLTLELIEVLETVDSVYHPQVVDIVARAGAPAASVMLKRFAGAPTKVKLTMLRTFKHLANEDVARQLVGRERDPDAGVRRHLAHVFGISGWLGTIPILKRLAADPVPCVRAAAFAALGWLGGGTDVEFLFRGLEDDHRDVREAAAGALVIVGGPKVVAKFNADLFHHDLKRQRLAVNALGLIGDATVVDIICMATRHQEPSMRRAAIDALARLGHLVDPGPLVVALHDENSTVRKSALTALVAIEGQRRLPDAVELLKDRDHWVRYHAVAAIAEVGSPECCRHLVPLLEDQQDIIKIGAIKALAHLRCSEALHRLSALREAANPGVAQAAEIAVRTLEGET